jgi:hypothetical protein
MEIVVFVIGCALGALIAWLLRGAQSKASQASAETHLAAAREQQATRGTELTALRGEHGRCPEVLALERERRAAAEEKAARVPQLEETLAVQSRTLSELLSNSPLPISTVALVASG